jgi:hypothetical protein
MHASREVADDGGFNVHSIHRGRLERRTFRLRSSAARATAARREGGYRTAHGTRRQVFFRREVFRRAEAFPSRAIIAGMACFARGRAHAVDSGNATADRHDRSERPREPGRLASGVLGALGEHGCQTNVSGDRAATGQANQHAGPKRRFGPPRWFAPSQDWDSAPQSRGAPVPGRGQVGPSQPRIARISRMLPIRVIRVIRGQIRLVGAGARTVQRDPRPHTRTSSQLPQRRAPLASSRPTSHERGPTPDWWSSCPTSPHRANDHVQSAATERATRPVEPNAARLQHMVRAVAERRPSPFVLGVIVPRGRRAEQAFFSIPAVR